jgi:ankyrin repeat protein
MERNHHRSKSQLAKSLLHKVSSARDSVKSNDDTADNPPSLGPEASSLASDSNVSLRTPNRLSRSRSQNPPTASSSLADSGIVSPPETDSMPPPQTGPVGLEQSVRLFRYVEALRSGDKEAIAKAIKEQEPGSPARLQETTLLHLAIQCAEFPVIERVLAASVQAEKKPATALNARDKDGNTPLHVASRLGRVPVVRALLEQDDINDAISNLKAETPLDVAYSADVFQELQLARSLYVDANIRKIQSLVAQRDYGGLEKLLNDSRVRTTIDLNGMELATDRSTTETGGTLLHEAARKREVKLIQVLLMNGADPFRRDRKGKLAQDVTKDEKTRHILKRSPAAEAAKRSVQEKSILGAAQSQAGSVQNLGENPLGGKESREMKGYLKKWTNYTSGWKLRWFVLEEGVLSYYKHQGTEPTSSASPIDRTQMTPAPLAAVRST